MTDIMGLFNRIILIGIGNTNEISSLMIPFALLLYVLHQPIMSKTKVKRDIIFLWMKRGKVMIYLLLLRKGDFVQQLKRCWCVSLRKKVYICVPVELFWYIYSSYAEESKEGKHDQIIHMSLSCIQIIFMTCNDFLKRK